MVFINHRYVYYFKDKLSQLLGKKYLDDFDWGLYSEHYRGELTEISKIHTLILKPNDYVVVDGRLKLNSEKVLPLHPNHRLLYETILELAPTSLIEIGCGGGDHLFNLSILGPNISLYGVELSQEQLEFLFIRHPGINANLRRLDVTLPHPLNSPQVDLAYTQAVIMHLQTGNNYLVALANLFKYAKKQVILVENWKKHNFMESIKYLYKNNMLPWESIFFYYRESEESHTTRIMIISAERLHYQELTNYAQLGGD